MNETTLQIDRLEQIRIMNGQNTVCVIYLDCESIFHRTSKLKINHQLTARGPSQILFGSK